MQGLGFTIRDIEFRGWNQELGVGVYRLGFRV